jgi:1,4-dihydroxy-2-naphthoate octaprenyltransferase
MDVPARVGAGNAGAVWPMSLRRLLAWVRMARPVILPAGVMAYALGLAMASPGQGRLHWAPALAGLAVTLLANLAAHFADEFADMDTDSLTRRTAFTGGSGVLPSGELPPSAALRAARLFLGLALGSTVVFYAASILPAACVGLAVIGALGGWVYSMPPVALERRGWGEIDNAALGGIVMPLMGYASQTGVIRLEAVLSLLPMFALVLVNLLGTHWPDRAADAQVGRRSIVVVLGPHARRAHHVLVLATYLAILLLSGWVLPPQVVFGLMLSLPVAIWASAVFGRQESPVPSSMTMVVGFLGASAGWLAAGSA